MGILRKRDLCHLDPSTYILKEKIEEYKMGEMCRRRRIGGNLINNFSCILQQQKQKGRNEVNRDYVKID